VGRVYCDDAGQPARASGITLDITRKKAAEAGIQALNAGLEARIQARTAELEAEIAARRQLEDELRALNDTLERRVAERTAEILAAQAALGESELRYRTLFEDTRQPLAPMPSLSWTWRATSSPSTIMPAGSMAIAVMNFCGCTSPPSTPRRMPSMPLPAWRRSTATATPRSRPGTRMLRATP
jgi:hypothetical protein